MNTTTNVPLAKAIQEIQENGFYWNSFREYFPFGFLGIREGEYYELLNTALDALANEKQKAALLDLIDAQWCLFVEQLWLDNEFNGSSDQHAGEIHFALARLQIDSNIRRERRLVEKDGRLAMLNLDAEETLFDRMIRKR